MSSADGELRTLEAVRCAWLADADSATSVPDSTSVFALILRDITDHRRLQQRRRRADQQDSLTGLRLVDTRANLLEAGNLVDAAALDKYTFSRDVYLHRRQSLIREEIAPAEERFDLPEVSPPAGTSGTRTVLPAPAPGAR